MGWFNVLEKITKPLFVMLPDSFYVFKLINECFH